MDKNVVQTNQAVDIIIDQNKKLVDELKKLKEYTLQLEREKENKKDQKNHHKHLVYRDDIRDINAPTQNSWGRKAQLVQDELARLTRGQI